MRSSHRNDASHVHGEVVGIVCRHVRSGERPLLEVWHDPDGVWQFLCGADDHAVEDADPICARCGFADHVRGLAPGDVPPAFVAERRSGDDSWTIRPMTDDELDDEQD